MRNTFILDSKQEEANHIQRENLSILKSETTLLNDWCVAIVGAARRMDRKYHSYLFHAPENWKRKLKLTVYSAFRSTD